MALPNIYSKGTLIAAAAVVAIVMANFLGGAADDLSGGTNVVTEIDSPAKEYPTITVQHNRGDTVNSDGLTIQLELTPKNGSNESVTIRTKGDGVIEGQQYVHRVIAPDKFQTGSVVSVQLKPNVTDRFRTETRVIVGLCSTPRCTDPQQINSVHEAL